MLLEDGRDSLRMENEALRKRNKQLELAAEPAGARILKLARENDALRKRNEKLERVAGAAYQVWLGKAGWWDTLADALSDLDEEDT